MFKQKNKKVNRLTVNLLNNQNYIIDIKNKREIIFNFLLKKTTNSSFAILILNLSKKLVLGLYDFSFFRKNTQIIFFILHFILILLFFPIYFLNSFFYIIVYLFFSITIINTFYDYFLISMNVLGFRKGNRKNISYNDSLVHSFNIEGDIIGNDGKAWLNTLYYTVITHFILFIFYTILKYNYA